MLSIGGGLPSVPLGLRCLQNLRRGEFLDTYIGEVITTEAAESRRAQNELSKKKEVYLFDLDKFHEDDDFDHQDKMFVVDGEYLSGPTRFMNHSCDPNMRQFTVLYNHADYWIYDLAFFAIKDVPARTELTFDYVDSDCLMTAENFSQDKAQGMTKCLCGSSEDVCRGYLWL